MRSWLVRGAAAVVVVAIAAAAALAFPAWAPVLAGFLLGVVGAGAGAVIEATIVDERRRRGTLRALIAEIEENIERVGPADRSAAPIRITRSAWEAARALELGADVFDTLRRAYAIGEDLNSRVGIMDRFVSSAVSTADTTDARRHHQEEIKGRADEIGKDCHRVARDAFAAFVKARDALKARG